MRKSKRKWEVILLRHRGEHLGVVTAPDEQAAERVAVKMLALDKARANRLLIRPLAKNKKSTASGARV